MFGLFLLVFCGFLVATCKAAEVDLFEIGIGCDGVFGSSKEFDICGVCGGDGTKCDIVEGVFRGQLLSNTFHNVVNIPSGATRINITEMSNSRSYLALRSTSGLFYINGNLDKGIPDPSNVYNAAGTSFIYKRPFQSLEGESLLAEGPTNDEIQVWVWLQRENPGIRYKFVIPKDTSTTTPERSNTHSQKSKKRPIIDISDDTDDMMDDGPITVDIQDPLDLYPANQDRSKKPRILTRPKYRPDDAFDIDDQYRSQSSRYHRWYQRERLTAGFVTRSDHYPEGLGRGRAKDRDEQRRRRRIRLLGPQQVVISNRVHELVNATAEDGTQGAVWVHKGYGTCSKSCGGGVKLPRFRCQTNEGSKAKKLPDNQCPSEYPKWKPKKCNKKSCSARFVVGEWTPCSVSCGTGRRTRMVSCKQKLQGKGHVTAVSRKHCKNQIKPANFETCTMPQCAARWKRIGKWSECSVSCGVGVQTHEAVCMSADDQQISDENCPALWKNSLQRKCDQGPCMSHWFMSDWGKCSADCSDGVQKRTVVCKSTVETEEESCSEESKPSETQTCSEPECRTTYLWLTSDWSECSVDCGDGIQKRLVYCLETSPSKAPSISSDERLCDAESKPTESRLCSAPECKGKWHYTAWNKCSKSCGGGHRRRQTHCLNPSGGASESCDEDEQPNTVEECNMQTCPAEDNDTCQDHLSTCRYHRKAKLCVYRYYRKACCKSCSFRRRKTKKTERVLLTG